MVPSIHTDRVEGARFDRREDPRSTRAHAPLSHSYDPREPPTMWVQCCSSAAGAAAHEPRLRSAKGHASLLVPRRLRAAEGRAPELRRTMTTPTQVSHWETQEPRRMHASAVRRLVERPNLARSQTEHDEDPFLALLEANRNAFERGLLTSSVPRLISGRTPFDKGTPGESRGRKATGPRRPPRRRTVFPPDATKDPTTAELPTGDTAFPSMCSTLGGFIAPYWRMR